MKNFLKYILLTFVVIFILFFYDKSVAMSSEVPIELRSSNLSWVSPTLNVFIQNDYKIVKDSFIEWNNKAGNPFNLVFIEKPEKADILVFNKNEKYKQYGALTTYFHDDKNIIRVYINLPKKYFNKKNIDSQLNEFVIKHEIGHSLGIFRHSTNQFDIMFPYKTQENNDITKNDIELLRKSFSVNNDNSEKILSKINCKYDLSYQANIYKQAGNYDEAIKIYNQILKENPNFLPAIYSKGYCYFKQKKYSKSEKCIRIVYQKENDNPIYLNSYIKVLCILGKRKLAEETLKIYIEKNPQYRESTLIRNCFALLNNLK